MRFNDFALERYFAKYEFDIKYLLCSSDCESFTIDDILKFSETDPAELTSLSLGYTESLGSPELRNEVSKLYSSVNADEIIIHSGAEEAILTTLNSLLTKDDHVIVQYPCYQSLTEIVKSVGCELSLWKSESNPEWDYNTDDLNKLIKPNTKLFVINSPHNPTGYLLTQEKINSIVKIAREKNIFIFSDEVYKGLEFESFESTSSICEIYENGISLGVMSKSFGLAGLRIGWVVSKNENVLKNIASFKDYTTICNSAPSEFIAQKALECKTQILDRNRKIITDNFKLLTDFAKKNSDHLTFGTIKSGPICFPKLIDKDSQSFCEELVKVKNVLLLPGNLYGIEFSKNIRIGFGRKNFPKALSILDEFLNK